MSHHKHKQRFDHIFIEVKVPFCEADDKLKVSDAGFCHSKWAPSLAQLMN